MCEHRNERPNATEHRLFHAVSSAARLPEDVSTYSQTPKRRNLWEEIDVSWTKVPTYGTKNRADLAAPPAENRHEPRPSHPTLESRCCRHSSRKSLESGGERFFPRVRESFRGYVSTRYINQICDCDLWIARRRTLPRSSDLSSGLMTFYLWICTEIGALSRAADEDSQSPHQSPEKPDLSPVIIHPSFRHRPEREVPAANAAHRNRIDARIPNTLTVESRRVP